MERIAFKLKLKNGMEEEYKKRHDEIWPEMTEILNDAGIHNYSIWLLGNDLFGYYETEDIEYAVKIQKESDVVLKWNEYMSNVIDSILLDDGSYYADVNSMECMFYHK
ncbi:L-rhamnose mutarotase [Clostridium grantii]|uniref:L-rhamnose mutarotase n=1 Tax=Clostridium grantii DSM 8605 TaxID=1121316 RepID=A0A1M5SW57_9CLOT|nr:L-rhamnose mutarotase [Clostridium grantii]SHH42811.1 L-rhamnose mutarotase [Clostridium grantii DSM 8605]